GIMEELGEPLAPGMVVELPVGWDTFFRPLCNRMRQGEGWILDYGERRWMLRSRYPEGTLLAYRRHQVVEDVLEAPGEQDITAFVDFDALTELLTSFGCTVDPPVRQDRFLMEAGIAEALQRYEQAHPEERTGVRLAMKTLLFQFPTFRVVRFHKSPPTPRTT
ncbi:MAG: SAM-dependent methyltransferase, partial [Candidatus Hydrothermae bacterium]|nr:SAM-dependent methyltransferase [Candidatus Hydrothermae bacterium]